jgi:nicotinamidase-related amidase
MDSATRTGRPALLIIDTQVGVMAGCWEAAAVLDRTRNLVERARSEGALVVWVQDEDDFPRDSDDWQLAEPLDANEGEPRVFKTRRDAFMGTGLGELLAGEEITRVVVAGAQSDYCIRTTSQRAAAEGYDVVLVSDCHTTVDAHFDGETITAAQIVAHSNMYFSGLRYAGQMIGTARHDDPLLFSGDVARTDDGEVAAS